MGRCRHAGGGVPQEALRSHPTGEVDRWSWYHLLMITVSSATPPVRDTMNPDPGVTWAVMWVHADDANGALLRKACDEGEIIEDVLGMFPGMTWLLSTVVVEEVAGDGSYYRIRFSEASRYA